MTDNTERAEYERRITELLDALEAVIDSHGTVLVEYVSSDYRASDANAIRLLARYGRCVIEIDDGSDVRGRWIPVADRKPVPAPAPSPPTSQAAATDVDRRCAAFAFERYMLPRGSC